MRIVGGKFKGRNLTSFKGEDIRPTSDQTRESLFNILQFEIAGKSFLDLFCGTGAVGIEALSRGARKVILNDGARESVALAKKNLELIGNPDGITVKNYDALEYLKTTEEKFDYIFMDPPYKSGLYESALLLSARVLNDGGTVILESETPLNIADGELKFVREKKYGRARLSFYKR